ncbi:MAG: 5-oxoprolinase subunit PxpB [Geobacteraceae bacterium]
MIHISEDTTFSLRFLRMGEQGLVVELGAGIEPALNARVLRFTSVLKEHTVPGIREVVPSYRSLLILFDPLLLSRKELRETVVRLSREVDAGRANPQRGKEIQLPVCYGGIFGPDLEFVANHNGLSPDEVIALHSRESYPVYMLGFLPGFPYLGGLPPELVTPRLQTPRQKVAAGSVGIAGNQTGVYPLESPGGWRIIGRTPLRLFDPFRVEPFLVSPGDRVRFKPIDRKDYARMESSREASSVSAACSVPVEQPSGYFSVIKPGLLTTVQDRGREGFRVFGVSPGGAMDSLSSRMANLLAGNDPGAAVLEMTLLGGSFRFKKAAYVAVSGADMGCRLNGVPLQNWSAFSVPAGGELTFGHAVSGCRAYLAVRGGICVPPVLGSRATFLRAGIGGFGGRALLTGDLVPFGKTNGNGTGQRILPVHLVPEYPDEIRLRVVPGPQDDLFEAEGLRTLFNAVYTVTPRNDRMAYCLSGPPIRHRDGADIISDALCAGAVQVSGDGLPLVMTADHQTTGGYAKIGAVIAPDLNRLVQARQGTRVRFVRCSDSEAVRVLRMQEKLLAGIASSLAQEVRK